MFCVFYCYTQCVAADGSCFLINDRMEVELELVGPDCDPVYRAATDDKYIYTTCRDGAVRKYSLNAT